MGLCSCGKIDLKAIIYAVNGEIDSALERTMICTALTSSELQEVCIDVAQMVCQSK